MSRLTGSPLVTFLLRRLLLTAVLLLGVTAVTFVLTTLVPSDPVTANLGERASADPEIVAEFRAQNGLDDPLPTRYLTYLGNVLQGDLGVSQQTRQPVAEDLATAVPATVELTVVAIVASVVIGVGLGLLAALRRGSFLDSLTQVVSLTGISVPSFWLALIVYYVLFFQLGLFPGSGRLSSSLEAPPHVTGLYTVDALLAGQWITLSDALAHIVLPASVLTLYCVGLLTRFTRSAVLEVLDQDYVRAARAKGLSEARVVRTYVLRAALVPILTVVGLALGGLLSGTVLVEAVFGWPGLGSYAYKAATKLDLPAVMGVGLAIGLFYIVTNLVVDLLHGVIDPRVRTR